MKGLELSRAYYEEFGKTMLEKQFPNLIKYIAVGFVGSGSERYGFDDVTSQDHDFEPGFCIFLPGEDVVDRRSAFLLERAYAKLPKDFMGFKRQPLSPVGGNRNGVMRTSEFYGKAIGAPDGKLSAEAWLHIPDYALAEAVNGEVFFDAYGEFTNIRESLQSMPQDIKLKRLAGNLLIMAQSGQYNFRRCIEHGEPEAALLACHEFVSSAMKVIFLLRGKYLPYYKWSFRALRELDTDKKYSEKLAFLISGGAAERKYNSIEEICTDIISELKNFNITKATCGDLEKHAYSVNDCIYDGGIRNLHILAAT